MSEELIDCTQVWSALESDHRNGESRTRTHVELAAVLFGDFDEHAEPGYIAGMAVAFSKSALHEDAHVAHSEAHPLFRLKSDLVGELSTSIRPCASEPHCLPAARLPMPVSEYVRLSSPPMEKVCVSRFPAKETCTVER